MNEKNQHINFACLYMKMSNQNLFKKTFLYKTSYISVCSKIFLRLFYYIYIYNLYIIKKNLKPEKKCYNKKINTKQCSQCIYVCI